MDPTTSNTPLSAQEAGEVFMAAVALLQSEGQESFDMMMLQLSLSLVKIAFATLQDFGIT